MELIFVLKKEISFIKNRRHLTYALYITCIKSLVIFSLYLLRYIFIIFVFLCPGFFTNLESTVTITTDGAFEVSSVDTVTRWILFIDPKLPQTFIITYIRLYFRVCEVLRLTFDTILFSIRRYLYYLGCSEYRVEEAWVRWTDSSTFLFSTLLILFVKKSEHAFDISIRQSPNARGITFEDML